jgi:DNA-binding NarL/FixJ family response regulator
VTTVLIVDDEPMMCRLVRRHLEFDDTIEVVGEAANGAQALEQWRSLRPDVIVLDHMMPSTTGLDVARIILDEDPTQSIILFTAAALGDSWRDTALQLGVSACLPKESSAALPQLIIDLAADAG